MITASQPAIPEHCSELTTAGALQLDTAIHEQYQALAPWGLATSIDLGACDWRRIGDAACIRSFVIALCDRIEMRRFGEPVIVRFGDDPRVCGYSLAQLIETSLISGHFAEASSAAFIDVFSCKPYPPYGTALFCKEWFGARTLHVTSAFRFAVALSGSSAAAPAGR